MVVSSGFEEIEVGDVFTPDPMACFLRGLACSQMPRQSTSTGPEELSVVQWLLTHGWPPLGLTRADLVSRAERSVFAWPGYWWGLEGKEGSEELLIHGRALAHSNSMVISSSPTVLTEFSPLSVSALRIWWNEAKRYAAQYFWTSDRDATPVFLVTRAYKARQIAMNSSLPANTNILIRVSGTVDQSGRLALSQDDAWRDVRQADAYLENGPKIRKSTEPKTFALNVLGYKLFCIDDERRTIKESALAIWR